MKVFLEAASVWCRDAATVMLLGPGTWCAGLVEENPQFPPSPSFVAAFAVGTLSVLVTWPVAVPVLGLSWLANNLAGMVEEQQKIL